MSLTLCLIELPRHSVFIFYFFLNSDFQSILMKKTFPHDVGLTTRTAILVPSTKHGNQKIFQKEFASRVRETENFMNKEFGGSTVTRGMGSYTIDSQGKKPKLVQENVVIVENFSKPKDWKKHMKEVEKFVESKQVEWTQDSVGFEIQTSHRPLSLHFVKAHDPAIRGASRKKLRDVA